MQIDTVNIVMVFTKTSDSAYGLLANLIELTYYAYYAGA